MNRSFGNRDLKRLWLNGDGSGIRPDWRRKVQIVLSALDRAATPDELDLPGFGFHALTGDRLGRHAIVVSRNWRITFAWAGEDAIDIDMEDYHGR